MCELDERRIRETAKLPPRVTRGAGGTASREEAHRVMERVALMPDRERDPRSTEDLD